MKKCNIGGQGVLEGVMMRGERKSALAVRNTKGKIVVKEWLNSTRFKNHPFFSLPIVRGVVAFIEMLVAGVTTVTDAAKMLDESMEYEPNRVEKFIAGKTGKNAMDVMIAISVVISLALAIGLFFVLPTVITNFFKTFITNPGWLNLLDGVIRVLIFLGYVIIISNIRDVKRMFRYHGSEHKTINCYEHERELTVENVQTQSTLHPRCGTSYLLIVMVISILIFSLLGWSENAFARIGVRLLLLPVVAGVSYEILKYAAKAENWFVRAIRWPGMQLQRITTAQPDDSMVQVAIVAFEMALEQKSSEEIAEMRERFSEEKEEPEHEQDRVSNATVKEA